MVLRHRSGPSLAPFESIFEAFARTKRIVEGAGERESTFFMKSTFHRYHGTNGVGKLLSLCIGVACIHNDALQAVSSRQGQNFR